GTAAWWLVRLEWIVILSLVTAVEMMLLWWQRRFFAAPLPMLGVPLSDRWGEVVMLAGALMAAAGLHLLAQGGFAPDGRFSWVTAAAFAAGVVLVALRPKEVSRRSVGPAAATG
ncbi:MAG: acyltransferase, partial [Mycobacterium sp.]